MGKFFSLFPSVLRAASRSSSPLIRRGGVLKGRWGATQNGNEEGVERKGEWGRQGEGKRLNGFFHACCPLPFLRLRKRSGRRATSMTVEILRTAEMGMGHYQTAKMGIYVSRRIRGRGPPNLKKKVIVASLSSFLRVQPPLGCRNQPFFFAKTSRLFA